ncbi:hypothetical protein [Nocardioides gilvus]|uniref:hypothetical protein n=1 Tax=Nocardioides gilvus TaxID=1735589 RepID=UPI000D74F795|nr:hypothetical protein [Nocardioides gilvus]
MDVSSLNELVDELLTKARGANAGRAAHTVHGGQEHQLRQTVIALASGHELAEHDSPGEATLQVLTGRVRLAGASGSAEGGVGSFMLIPLERHSLAALEDSAVLLTVVVQ